MPDIRDGDAYSITLPDAAQACILYPAGLYDPASCPADARPMAEPPRISPESRVLTLGSVKVDDAGQPAPATVVATVTELSGNAEPRDVTAFAHGMAEGLVRSKKGATLRRGPEARVVTLGGVRAARITFDVDHLSDHGFDHVVSYAAWSEAADYNLTFMAAPSHAAAIDALADRVATTLRIARPAAPPPAGDPAGYLAGAVVGALLVPALLWGFRARARRNRAAPAGAK